MSSKDRRGEGNPDADRRYRQGVRDTVSKTSDKERADKARDLSDDDKSAAKRAEEKGKSKARS
ncbi:MAG: hypothetical protein R3305_03255 [Gammaproteobacteria bacterium]|nr:hypothetical protein [Gammaproteobacteria bacterium]